MTPTPALRWFAAIWSCCVTAAGAVILVVFLAIAVLVWGASLDDHPLPSLSPSPAPSGEVAPGGQFTGTPADVTYSGTIAYADESYGALYLALPEPRGTLATICGPRDCITRTSTDYGPDQRVHPDRIADVSSVDFEAICGELRFGTCPGSVTIERRPRLTLPPTDGE